MNDVEYLRNLAQRLLPARETSDDDTTRLMGIANKFEELDERDTILSALENGGVDNWEWFDASLEDAGL